MKKNMKKIPILDLKKQIKPLRSQIDRAIGRVIDNVDFIFSKQTEKLEEEICAYSKARFAVAVSNGTDAIRLSLLSLGVKEGDAVICPAFTYYATAGAIAGIGAIPVFADIDPDTYNLSLAHLKRAIKRYKRPGLKAVLPVHLYGQCADMDPITRIAKKYRLKVVEDAAQAFGAGYKGKKAGTIGDCGALSFFPGKNLGAFGDAGMVLTNNKTLYKRLKILRNQGDRKKYDHSMIGYNNRMDTIQSVVLRLKLKYLDQWNRKRRRNAGYYDRSLKDLAIRTPSVPQYNLHIYHQYVLRLPGSSSGLIRHLQKKGIDARSYYPKPLHLQECFKYLGYKRGDFPESEKASASTLAIPVYPDLTKGELGYIAKTIKEFLR
ncbi:DegT/DnrJ/EryC1/StrS family aminotransferase [Candidatus Omnitrophota bacterium]